MAFSTFYDILNKYSLSSLRSHYGPIKPPMKGLGYSMLFLAMISDVCTKRQKFHTYGSSSVVSHQQCHLAGRRGGGQKITKNDNGREAEGGGEVE